MQPNQQSSTRFRSVLRRMKASATGAVLTLALYALPSALISLSAQALPATPTPATAPIAPAARPATAPSTAEYDPTTLPSTPSVETISREHGKPSFLWSVKSASNTIYLFGTIHVGKRSFYPLAPPVEAAIRASKNIVLEADISDDSSAREVARLIAVDYSNPLQRRIGNDLQARVKKQLERLQIPMTAIGPMKPYILGGFLSVAEYSRQGYDASAGVEAYLLAQARNLGKPVLELESQLGQLKLLDGMPFSLQETFLSNTLSSLESGKAGEQVDALVAAWQNGDADKLGKVVAEINQGLRLTNLIDDTMIYSRHPAMIDKIMRYLDSGATHFVAVGSLHLIGERGLVSLLRARGLTVTQL